jgi:hypothetical protein
MQGMRLSLCRLSICLQDWFAMFVILGGYLYSLLSIDSSHSLLVHLSPPPQPQHRYLNLHLSVPSSQEKWQRRSQVLISLAGPQVRISDAASFGIRRIMKAIWTSVMSSRLMPGFLGVRPHCLLAILASFHLSENPSLPSSLSPLLTLPDKHRTIPASH